MHLRTLPHAARRASREPSPRLPVTHPVHRAKLPLGSKCSKIMEEKLYAGAATALSPA
jgi:hypothetical protein